MRPCFALIAPGDAQVDPQHQQEPDLIKQTISITVGSVVPGDHMGQNPLIGANVPDRTKSEGRGTLEFEEELFAAVELLNADTGVVIQHRTSGAAKAYADDEIGYVSYRDYMFEAFVTADRYYHPATNFKATGGVGQVVLTWSLPPDRFDRYRMVLRRASGSTAPASVSSGTGVTLGSNLATSVTDTGLSAGTYSYALFATYDETKDAPVDTLATADRTSDSVTRTSVTVT